MYSPWACDPDRDRDKCPPVTGLVFDAMHAQAQAPTWCELAVSRITGDLSCAAWLAMLSGGLRIEYKHHSMQAWR